MFSKTNPRLSRYTATPQAKPKQSRPVPIVRATSRYCATGSCHVSWTSALWLTNSTKSTYCITYRLTSNGQHGGQDKAKQDKSARPGRTHIGRMEAPKKQTPVPHGNEKGRRANSVLLDNNSDSHPHGAKPPLTRMSIAPHCAASYFCRCKENGSPLEQLCSGAWRQEVYHKTTKKTAHGLRK